MAAALNRLVGELTSPEVAQRLSAGSILCLPLGATEQHGPHLPLNTDAVIAEALTRRIVMRWSDELDLWQLPTFAFGLSREHDWAAGTLSLSVLSFAALLRDLARELVRALPARHLLIVNGHGGNRGILDALLHEFAGDFGLNACVIHPFDLAGVENSAACMDVHGGRSETSMMLALAPHLVRNEALRDAASPHDAAPEAVHGLIFDRGASFPWRTDDARLAHSGVIGDPSGASAEAGEALIGRIVEAARAVLARLVASGRHVPTRAAEQRGRAP